jgi:Ca-activated chloride channel family protein
VGDAQQPTKVSARQVTLTVTITDKQGRYIGDLSKDQLTILDEKMPQEITSFEQINVPVNVGLVFDLSRPKFADLLAATRRDWLNFIEESKKANEYFIVGFDDNAYLVTDFTQNRESIAGGFNKLASAKPTNKTALYDAIHLSIEKVKGGPNPKHIIVLISDGKNNASKLKRNEMLGMVRQNDVLIYAISLSNNDSGATDPAALNELCASTGGMVFYPANRAEFDEVFERLAVELQHQYSVGFKPVSTAKDGEWHHLDFKVKPLEVKKSPAAKSVEKVPLFVRGREGFYTSF